jgi:hypothetical protein
VRWHSVYKAWTGKVRHKLRKLRAAYGQQIFDNLYTNGCRFPGSPGKQAEKQGQSHSRKNVQASIGGAF